MKKLIESISLRKYPEISDTAHVLLVNKEGEGQGFRNVKASIFEIRKVLGYEYLQLYPFRMKFKGKLYDIVCDEDGMANYKKHGIFTPHTAGMVAGDCKVEFYYNFGDENMVSLFDLKFNRVVPINPFTGEVEKERMPDDSVTGTMWAFVHFGPIAFVEASTNWMNKI